MSNVKLEVLLSTCSDERYPPSNAVDGKPNTFFTTTGSFPQELIFAVKSPSGAANISKITIVGAGLGSIRVDRSGEAQPISFEPLVEPLQVPPREHARQIEQFAINKATAGAKTRFVKLVLLSGAESPFAALYDFSVEGDEVA